MDFDYNFEGKRVAQQNRSTKSVQNSILNKLKSN